MTEEQLSRQAVQFGNGAHVLVPREWAGEAVLLTRQPQPPLQEQILSLVQPHLPDILGVYLFGSRARGEATPDSDVDLLIISSRKFDIKQKRFQVIVLPETSLDHAFQSQPLMLCAALAEAKPIINSQLLEKLKVQYSPEKASFREFLSATKRAVAICRGLLEGEGEETSGSAVAYSLVLRLRGIYLIRQLLIGQPYSHKAFRKWAQDAVPAADFSAIYETYRVDKNDQRVKRKLKIAHLEAFLSFLERETAAMKRRQYDKQKKTPAKRH